MLIRNKAVQLYNGLARIVTIFLHIPLFFCNTVNQFKGKNISIIVQKKRLQTEYLCSGQEKNLLNYFKFLNSKAE